MSWYSQGYSAIKKEEARLQALSRPDRFWMPAGASKQAVMLDDEPFNIHEHNAKINGNWRNHHTCVKGVPDYTTCRSCERLGGRSRTLTGYLSTVDCSLYTDKKGNKHQYDLKLIGAKLGSLKKWARKKGENDGMAGKVWRIFREDANKPAIGDEWSFDKVVEDPLALFNLTSYRGTKLSELWDKADVNDDALAVLKDTFQVTLDEDSKLVRVVPAFNYIHVLRPWPADQWAEMLGGAQASEPRGSTGSTSDGGTVPAEEDVPF